MSDWKDILRDRLSLTLPEPVKLLFDIAYSYGAIWAIFIAVIMAIIFHVCDYNFIAIYAGRRIAIDMSRTPPNHYVYKRTIDVTDIINGLNQLTRSNPEREVHAIISGGPGAGKSELARQVGEKIYHSENKPIMNFDLSFILPPTDVITLNADNFELLHRSLEEAIDTIQGKESKSMGYDRPGDEEMIFSKFHQLRVALKTVQGAMFTFLYKKRQNGKGFLNAGSKEYGKIRIIVATQRRPTAILPSFICYKDLADPIPTDEAVKLLNTITNIQNDDQNAAYLAKALSGFPKSLVDAAFHIQIGRRRNVSYRLYLEELELSRKRYLKKVNFSWAEVTDQGVSYNFTAYTASLMLVEQYFLDPDHGRLYKTLAFFIGYCGSPAISLTLFEKYVSLDSDLKDYVELEAVGILVGKTSLYDVKDRNREHYLILTHQITRFASFDAWNKKVETENDPIHVFQTSIARIFEALKSEFNNTRDQEVEYTSSSFKVIDVVMSLVTKIHEKKLNIYNIISKEFCWLFLYSIGPNSHKSAIIMPKVDFLVDMVDDSYQKNNIEISFLLSVLFFHSTGNQEPGNVKKVVKAIEELVLNSLSKPDNISIEKKVLLINMIGTVYRGLAQDWLKAQELHQLALNLSEKNSLKNEEAISLHLLGIIHRYQRNLDKALTYHEKAVELARRIFSTKEKGRLAEFLLNLAVVYNRVKEFDKARQMYEETLELVKKAYGPRHQRVAKVLNTLSTSYYALGKYPESINVLLEALSIHEEIHGDYHPHVAETLYFLGFTYRSNGDLSESLQVLKRSLKITQQYYGNRHFKVAEILHDLSNTQRELGMLNDALENANTCVHIFRKTLGENDSAVATSLNGVGLIYLELGDSVTAQRKFEEALKVLRNFRSMVFKD
ncbi:uncharacterized protein LOC124447062 [Xenia sp. Carnegie-2017]|uniref:uncharacterized protein LOC124447062 n=1 Tax=Xenia sp. Carnegie-2017 TaxID=2897299 RepID=UPI001F04961B|nr:uncharacterized protein LOC124447062 [Xenia sp. Carnegie-2017]